MKKLVIISVILIVGFVFLFLIINFSFTGNFVSEEKYKLGYCPTMQEDAEKFSKENDYELINFGSAVEVLHALKNNQIDKAIIGRKAEITEISSNTKETVLKSGYALVSNKKGFISNSQLFSIEIYTYLEMNFNFPVNIISKEEVLKKINEGKIVLISWEDWNDNFKLIVVINGNEKVKEFRGVFLYEN